MRLRTLQRTKRKSGKMQEAKSATIAISRVSICPLTSETEGEMNPDTVKYRAGSLLGGLLSLQLLYLLQFVTRPPGGRLFTILEGICLV